MSVFSESLPFRITPTHADYLKGIYGIDGLVRFSDGVLQLEYRHDLTGGLLKSDVQTRAIPLRDLREISVKRHLFGARLTLLANTLRLFEDVPGADNDRLVLRFGRGERHRAENFGVFLRAEHSELRLRED